MRAETSERAALRLQKEVDTLQVRAMVMEVLSTLNLSQDRIMEERQRTKRAEEDMENLVVSLNNI